jgi:cell shape-determining protein MreC
MEMCREFMAEQDKLKDENRTLKAAVKAQEAAAAESAKTIESLREENAKLTQSLAALTSNQHKVNALKDSVASVMTAWLALVGNDTAA